MHRLQPTATRCWTAPMSPNFPERSMVPNDASAGGGRFDLLTSDISSPEARFEGRFEGTLILFERLDDVPNPDDTIEVELYFDVTAKREEF